MEKVIYDKKNGLWYELQGDYYLLCLKLPEGLDILGRICVLLQLFAERCHKNTQGSNIVIPTAAPNVLGNKGIG